MAGKEGERVHSPRKALINEVRSSRQAQQTEKEGSYLYLAICMTSYILRHTEIVHLPNGQSISSPSLLRRHSDNLSMGI